MAFHLARVVRVARVAFPRSQMRDLGHRAVPGRDFGLTGGPVRGCILASDTFNDLNRGKVAMRKLVLALSVAGFVAVPCAVLSAQSSGGGDMSQCPMMEHGKDSHHAAMEMHGDEAMGFAHDKTTHHFLLAERGGVIEVKANDPGDNASVDAIRSHLAHIATMFKSGDFSAPMLVHSTIPPGVTAMKLLKKKIRYTYEPLDAGGRVGSSRAIRWRLLPFKIFCVSKSPTTRRRTR